MKFRLNYGNGTVSASFTTRAGVDREANDQREYYRRRNQPSGPLIVQLFDPDTQEWRTVP